MKNWEDYLLTNGTLKNKLGITDAEKLHTIEYNFSAIQQKFIRQNDYVLPDGYQLTGKDVGELRKINAVLLGDIYDWAGHYREVDFSKTTGNQVTHFHPVMLFGNAEWDIQRQLTAFVSVAADKDIVAAALGELVTEMNMFHPFREGNGRTLRVFTEVLAREKGFQLDFTQEHQEAYMAASIADDAKLMAGVFQQILHAKAN
ncbi:Fic/DOC family protein [Levilactobacillus cerevisiae]|uniref:Fic/DOC family protein n=1 Tax=Levilactobacillus cerevisiae TaxID=1704076 RepID=UPI000F77A353|nr:Fic family protein [Levilactobacillus cerevisiae]